MGQQRAPPCDHCVLWRTKASTGVLSPLLFANQELQKQGRSRRGEGPQAPGPAASSGASSPYPDRRPRPGRVRAARAEPRAWRAALSREPTGHAARPRPGWRLALNLRETLSSPFRGSDGNGLRPVSGCFESEFPDCHLNKNVRCRPVGEGLSLREPRALSGGRRPAGPGVLLWGDSGQHSCDC